MRPHNNTLVCLCCGGSMLSRRPDALWCSPGCKLKGNRIIKAEQEAGSPYCDPAVIMGLGIVIGEAPTLRCVGDKARPVVVSSKVKKRQRAAVLKETAASVARRKAKRAAKARDKRAMAKGGGGG